MRRSVVVIVETFDPGWARGLGRPWRERKGNNEGTSTTIADEDMKDWILFAKERRQ